MARRVDDHDNGVRDRRESKTEIGTGDSEPESWVTLDLIVHSQLLVPSPGKKVIKWIRGEKLVIYFQC